MVATEVYAHSQMHRRQKTPVERQHGLAASLRFEGGAEAPSNFTAAAL